MTRQEELKVLIPASRYKLLKLAKQQMEHANDDIETIKEIESIVIDIFTLVRELDESYN